MTWTVILFDGNAYTKGIFNGSPDRSDAMKEAMERFGKSWPPGTQVVVIIPGDHPVYIN
jgi:hypothetical protein